MVALAAGNFAATLVLAALSPLIALYYNSSAFWGAPVALASVAVALTVGLFSGARLLHRSGAGWGMRVPLTVIAVVQLRMGPLMLALSAALAGPVLHDGQREGDAIVWSSTVAVTGPCLPLVTPLLGGVEGPACAWLRGALRLPAFGAVTSADPGRFHEPSQTLHAISGQTLCLCRGALDGLVGPLGRQT